MYTETLKSDHWGVDAEKERNWRRRADITKQGKLTVKCVIRMLTLVNGYSHNPMVTRFCHDDCPLTSCTAGFFQSQIVGSTAASPHFTEIHFRVMKKMFTILSAHLLL